ncbi:MGH1-like glycoside hydrolase domain-containing protein [Flavihumibacter profundi]|uniref:MGH1-like glycoside hydrolase domain-containing protein n=1 Tax=Flavihumibacter profundi TaxID=2716883 RepID=UPI001CC38F2E|nr:glucosidase [Flavihumibacter profundi]MBZ5855912.1 glucosidase [Flavihumibacter profundi]
MNVEQQRLTDPKWKKWGPYVSDRQWATVREDYTEDGNTWEGVTYDMSRSYAYRWGEDGIAGICDEAQRICFSVAMWNKKDPFIKERLFGLTGPRGNHGEDVKELYYYLDSSPTHSYMKMLYKYPQKAFPYDELYAENDKRNREQPEFELVDTGIFDTGAYFDVFVEYAKATPTDILIKISVANRNKEGASLSLLPTVWFRNTWSWGIDEYKPKLEADGPNAIRLNHERSGQYFMYCNGNCDLLFCENETNSKRFQGKKGIQPIAKDGINEFIVNKKRTTISKSKTGTKASAHYNLVVGAGETVTVQLRLSREALDYPFHDFDAIFWQRMNENEEFYTDLQRGVLSQEDRRLQRQAYAGMLWSKQFYYYDVEKWLSGDPNKPAPRNRAWGRNHDWSHLNNFDIISMPDKWEYPWYAAWDLAFHCIPLAYLDPAFAKNQLQLLTKEWYMHPNGQFPAYEWNLGDVNPPVHAWATWRVYEIDKNMHDGKGDIVYLESVYHKLLLNFTWWVNRKDHDGNNIFQGGFLGLDNIGVFDRSAPLPGGGHLEQSDGTSWMAMYCLNLLRISLELAAHNHVYADMATKFFEHFVYIAKAMNSFGEKDAGLWDEKDQFFYDVLKKPDGSELKLRVRSMVGLIPLFAVEVIDHSLFAQIPEFVHRLEWFLKHKSSYSSIISEWSSTLSGEKHLLSLIRSDKLIAILQKVLDETEFLSEYGVRALSRFHEEHPFNIEIDGNSFGVKYLPAESDSNMFGGNSNWRGPIWFPLNYLIIESLQRYHYYYGEALKVEYPNGSGNFMTLDEVANELSNRLLKIFRTDENGRRPVNGDYDLLQKDPYFKDYFLFYEYFHGDNGRGVGASHQTGWTGLVAKLLHPRH